MKSIKFFLFISMVFTFFLVEAVSLKVQNKGAADIKFAFVDTSALKKNFLGDNLKYFFDSFKEWKLWNDFAKFMKIDKKNISLTVLKKPNISTLERNIPFLGDVKKTLILRVGSSYKFINVSEEYAKDKPYLAYRPKTGIPKIGTSSVLLKTILSGILMVNGKNYFLEYLLTPLEQADALSVYEFMHLLDKENGKLTGISGGKVVAKGSLTNLEKIIKKYRAKYNKLNNPKKKSQLMFAILIIENIKKQMKRMLEV